MFFIYLLLSDIIFRWTTCLWLDSTDYIVWLLVKLFHGSVCHGRFSKIKVKWEWTLVWLVGTYTAATVQCVFLTGFSWAEVIRLMGEHWTEMGKREARLHPVFFGLDGGRRDFFGLWLCEVLRNSFFVRVSCEARGKKSCARGSQPSL